MGMPVSNARLREIRTQLDDAARDLGSDSAFAELADIVTAAKDEFDAMVDERGQLVDAPAVEVGSRVKRAPAEEPDGPDARGVVDEPGSPDAPEARKPKRKVPAQFRR